MKLTLYFLYIVFMDKSNHRYGFRRRRNRRRFGSRSPRLASLQGTGINSPLYQLMPEHGLYVYQDAGGWVLAGVITCSGDILASETSLMAGRPSYFTASGHFTSPLWRLRRLADMAGAGAPAFRYRLLLTDPTARICNLHSMLAGDWHGLGLEVLTRERYAGGLGAVMVNWGTFRPVWWRRLMLAARLLRLE